MNDKTLTAEKVRQMLDYNPETGALHWKIGGGNRVIGKAAGTPHSKGYVAIGLCGKYHKAHRLVWLHVTGKWPSGELDHINFCRNDNRIENLRVVTRAENTGHRAGPRKGNKTGFLGVSRSGSRFIARATVNGEEQYLGTFPTPETAHAAYRQAKQGAQS
jgi:hypothetical protein